MAEYYLRKKNNLPVKVKVVLGGAGAKTGSGVFNGDTMVFKTVFLREGSKFLTDQLES